MTIDDTTKEYFEKLKLAEKFTRGDIEKARQMLRGEFQDVIVIKGRFKDEDEKIFGLFQIFFSIIKYYLIECRCIVSDYASVYNNKPFDNWKIFLSKLEREITDTEHHTDKMNALKD